MLAKFPKLSQILLRSSFEVQPFFTQVVKVPCEGIGAGQSTARVRGTCS
jgi:hypothetical protein